MSKKSLITAASTAALVATIGFAYAQSSDEEAYNRANINGTVDNNVPKHWARDMVNSDPYDTAAPTAAGPMTSTPSDTESRADTSTSSSTTATPPAADATSPWAADSTSTPAPAAAPSNTTTTAPVNTTDPVNQTNSSLSTNTAPSETHVDLNSPNDPIYNLGKDSYDSERAPRPDRN
jgi:hypothetical protein